MDQRTPPSWRQSEVSGELCVGNCLVYMWIWLKQTSPLRASVYLKHGVWGKMGTFFKVFRSGKRDTETGASEANGQKVIKMEDGGQRTRGA